MKAVFLLVGCLVLLSPGYTAELEDELVDYMDTDYDYSALMDKRRGKSVVDQLSSLLRNMKSGEFKVDKRSRKGILSFLYDMARKEKRVAGGIPRLSANEYFRVMEEAAERERRMNELSYESEKRSDRMRGGAWNSGK